MAKAKFRDIKVLLVKENKTIKSGYDMLKLFIDFEKLGCDTILFQWQGDRQHDVSAYCNRINKLMNEYLSANCRLRDVTGKIPPIIMLKNGVESLCMAFLSIEDERLNIA